MTQGLSKMARPKCVAGLNDGQGLGSLLLYLEQEVLKRHCCQQETFTQIGNDLGLTAAEARRIHDHASMRLALAIMRLLRDLQLERLQMDVSSVLREISEIETRDRQPSRRRSRHGAERPLEAVAA